MGRRLRFIPEGGALVEITCRTFQGRYLLKPSTAVNDCIAGALGRAQRLYPVEIHGFAFLSNHYHLLISVPDAQRMAQFVGYFNSNLARELGRIRDWTDKIFSRRYQAIVVSEEEAAQESRMQYLLSQGAKEGLVAHPGDWPGLQCAKQILKRQASLSGRWRNRTKERVHQCATGQWKALTRVERVELAPLPCWSDRGSRWIAQRCEELIELALEDIKQIGLSEMRDVDPTERPTKLKRSPATMFHCASKVARKFLYEAYCWFVAAYRDASEQLKAGNLKAAFPAGSFPPPRPFVVA